MAIQIPVKYSVLLQKTLELKTTGKLLFSMDYEGEIKKLYDRVKIPSVKRPRAQDYIPGTPLAIDNAVSNFDELVINQAKGWTQRIENFDSEASEINLPVKIIEEGGKSFAIAIDKYLIGLYAQVAKPNVIGSIAAPEVITKDTAVDIVSQLISTIRDKGTIGSINVLVPSLVSQYIPVSLSVTTPQPEIQAMGIEQGFQISGAMVYPSPLTKVYTDDTETDTLDGALSAEANIFNVNTGALITAGDIIKIDNELMYVVNVSGTGNKVIEVLRGIQFTDELPHADNADVTVQKESNIIFGADSTLFGAFAQKSQRIKVVDQIKGEDAAVIQSFLYFGAKVLNPLAGGVAYVKKSS